VRRVGGPKNDIYPTPDWLWSPLNELLAFDLDTAANKLNAKCRRYYDERQNGLVQPWNGGSVWCNPPYGATTGEWVWKGRRTVAEFGNRVTMLVPVKADTEWYSRGVWSLNRVVSSGRIDAGRIQGRWYRLKESLGFVELLELEGRIKFAADNTGWFASAVVLFNSGPHAVLPELRRVA
jgi:phage N-6-adenine-methyltransferase